MTILMCLVSTQLRHLLMSDNEKLLYFKKYTRLQFQHTNKLSSSGSVKSNKNMHFI